MKKTIPISVLLFSTLLAGALQAREMNPFNPDFNHNICLNTRSIDPNLGIIKYNKIDALESLANMTNFTATKQAEFAKLQPAQQAYYLKLRASLSNDGRELSSYLLDSRLDSAGSCEAVDSILIDIIDNLK